MDKGTFLQQAGCKTYLTSCDSSKGIISPDLGRKLVGIVMWLIAGREKCGWEIIDNKAWMGDNR